MIDFLTANWRWILLIGAFVWMHTRGGGCGMHGGHGHGGQHRSEESADQHSQHRGYGSYSSHDPDVRRKAEDRPGERGVHGHRT